MRKSHAADAAAASVVVDPTPIVTTQIRRPHHIKIIRFTLALALAAAAFALTLTIGLTAPTFAFTCTIT